MQSRSKRFKHRNKNLIIIKLEIKILTSVLPILFDVSENINHDTMKCLILKI